MEVGLEFVIFAFLGTAGFYLIHQVFEQKPLRVSRTRRVLFLLLLMGWVTVFYGSFIEPRRLVVKEESITLSETPTQTLRVAVFSDVHVGPFKKMDWVERVTQTVMAQQPDLVLIPGDFVSTSPEEVKWLQPLSGLNATYGVYAVTGNHEYHAEAAQEVIDQLTQSGIRVLQNASVAIEQNGVPLEIAGVSDIWFDGDLSAALAQDDPEVPTILLAHNPDVMLDPNSRFADFVVAAHTHGGQIRLPWIGPVPALPTKLGRAYDKGWFIFDQTRLFITSGVGETGTRARLFNPPEIIMMTLSY